jgi:hypothetical protein
MESPKAGFPPFPHSLEIPAGLPHFHGLDDEIIGKQRVKRNSIGRSSFPIWVSAMTRPMMRQRRGFNSSQCFAKYHFQCDPPTRQTSFNMQSPTFREDGFIHCGSTRAFSFSHLRRHRQDPNPVELTTVIRRADAERSHTHQTAARRKPHTSRRFAARWPVRLK